VLDVSVEFAEPFTSETAPPTWAPPVGQPAAVTSEGWHRKNFSEPVGVGRLPTVCTVASSCWAVPGATWLPPGVAVVTIGGGGQVLN